MPRCPTSPGGWVPSCLPTRGRRQEQPRLSASDTRGLRRSFPASRRHSPEHLQVSSTSNSKTTSFTINMENRNIFQSRPITRSRLDGRGTGAPHDRRPTDQPDDDAAVANTAMESSRGEQEFRHSKTDYTTGARPFCRIARRTCSEGRRRCSRKPPP